MRGRAMILKAWLTWAEDWLMAELNRLQEIKIALYNAHAFYDERLRAEKLEMMAELLEDFDPEAIRQAIRAWMLAPPEKGHKPRPPMPNELIALMQPQLTPEQEGSDIAGQICGAISKYGWNNAKAAKAALPEIAWQILSDNYGGWPRFCEMSHERDMVNIRAQLRDQIAASIKRRGLSEQAGYRALPKPPAFKSVQAAQQPRGSSGWENTGTILQGLLPQV